MLSYQHSTLSGGVLIVESMNPRGCMRGVLIVPRGYKIYLRCGYCFKLCRYTRHIIHTILVVFLSLGP